MVDLVAISRQYLTNPIIGYYENSIALQAFFDENPGQYPLWSNLLVNPVPESEIIPEWITDALDNPRASTRWIKPLKWVDAPVWRIFGAFIFKYGLPVNVDKVHEYTWRNYSEGRFYSRDLELSQNTLEWNVKSLHNLRQTVELDMRPNNIYFGTMFDRSRNSITWIIIKDGVKYYDFMFDETRSTIRDYLRLFTERSREQIIEFIDVSMAGIVGTSVVSASALNTLRETYHIDIPGRGLRTVMQFGSGAVAIPLHRVTLETNIATRSTRGSSLSETPARADGVPGVVSASSRVIQTDSAGNLLGRPLSLQPGNLTLGSDSAPFYAEAAISTFSRDGNQLVFTNETGAEFRADPTEGTLARAEFAGDAMVLTFTDNRVVTGDVREVFELLPSTDSINADWTVNVAPGQNAIQVYSTGLACQITSSVPGNSLRPREPVQPTVTTLSYDAGSNQLVLSDETATNQLVEWPIDPADDNRIASMALAGTEISISQTVAPVRTVDFAPVIALSSSDGTIRTAPSIALAIAPGPNAMVNPVSADAGNSIAGDARGSAYFSPHVTSLAIENGDLVFTDETGSSTAIPIPEPSSGKSLDRIDYLPDTREILLSFVDGSTQSIDVTDLLEPRVPGDESITGTGSQGAPLSLGLASPLLTIRQNSLDVTLVSPDPANKLSGPVPNYVEPVTRLTYTNGVYTLFNEEGQSQLVLGAAPEDKSLISMTTANNTLSLQRADGVEVNVPIEQLQGPKPDYVTVSGPTIDVITSTQQGNFLRKDSRGLFVEGVPSADAGNNLQEDWFFRPRLKTLEYTNSVLTLINENGTPNSVNINSLGGASEGNITSMFITGSVLNFGMSGLSTVPGLDLSPLAGLGSPPIAPLGGSAVPGDPLGVRIQDPIEKRAQGLFASIQGAGVSLGSDAGLYWQDTLTGIERAGDVLQYTDESGVVNSVATLGEDTTPASIQLTNYDLNIGTFPPVSLSPALLLRGSGVSGEGTIDAPFELRVSEDASNLLETRPDGIFAEAGAIPGIPSGSDGLAHLQGSEIVFDDSAGTVAMNSDVHPYVSRNAETSPALISYGTATATAPVPGFRVDPLPQNGPQFHTVFTNPADTSTIPTSVGPLKNFGDEIYYDPQLNVISSTTTGINYELDPYHCGVLLYNVWFSASSWDPTQDATRNGEGVSTGTVTEVGGILEFDNAGYASDVHERNWYICMLWSADSVERTLISAGGVELVRTVAGLEAREDGVVAVIATAVTDGDVALVSFGTRNNELFVRVNGAEVAANRADWPVVWTSATLNVSAKDIMVCAPAMHDVEFTEYVIAMHRAPALFPLDPAHPYPTSGSMDVALLTVPRIDYQLCTDTSSVVVQGALTGTNGYDLGRDMSSLAHTHLRYLSATEGVGLLRSDDFSRAEVVLPDNPNGALNLTYQRELGVEFAGLLPSDSRREPGERIAEVHASARFDGKFINDFW